MAAGTAKLQLLIELKNRLNAGINSARRQVDRSVGNMQRRLDSLHISSARLRAGFREAFAGLQSEIPVLGRVMNVVRNPLAGVAAGVAAVGTGFYRSVKMAADWNDKIAEINVTAQKSPGELKKLSDELLKIGGRNANNLDEVPKAFSAILGATDDVNKSMATLEPTLKAAKAGYVDVETAARAATSVMGSAGVNGQKALDTIIATVKSGNAGFADVANYMPKIIPMAKQIGVTLGETAGAYAQLTKSLPAESAATSLQGVMRALSNSKVVDNFKKTGVTVFDAEGKMLPVVDILKNLNAQMDGLTDKQKMMKFDGLGLDQMGTIGFSSLMQNVDELEKTINETTNSAGALEDAFNFAKTPMDEWKITMNQIKVYAIQLGNAVLPIVTAIGKGALWVAQNIDIIGAVLAGLGVGFALFNAGKIAVLGYAAAMKIASIATGLFNAVMNMSPLGWIATVIGLVITAVTICYKRFDKFRAVIQGSWEVIKGFGTILKDFVIDRIKGLISGIGTIGSAFQKLFSGDFAGAWQDAKKGFIEITGIDAARKAFESTKGLKDNFTNKYDEVLADAAKKKAEESEGDFAGVPDTTAGNPVTNNNSGSNNGLDDARKISGGSQTKNITINIDSFIKGFNPTSQTINSMNTSELEKWMTEMFTRVIRSAEMAM